MLMEGLRCSTKMWRFVIISIQRKDAAFLNAPFSHICKKCSKLDHGETSQPQSKPNADPNKDPEKSKTSNSAWLDLFQSRIASTSIDIHRLEIELRKHPDRNL